jgi:hypothetical protein
MPYTHLFAYKPYRDFVLFSILDYIEPVLFKGHLGSMYQNKYKQEFNDIFNCVHQALIQSFEIGGAEAFETHFKMLLLANAWSDPHVLFSILNASCNTLIYTPERFTRSSMVTWMEWIKNTKNIASDGIRGMLQEMLGELGPLRGASVNQELLDKLNKTVKIQFKSIKSPWGIQSDLLNGPLKEILYVFRKFVEDVMGGDFRDKVLKIIGDLRVMYGWYFKDPRSINTITKRTIGEIIIQKTFQLDQYHTISKTYQEITVERIVDRYDEAKLNLGNYKKRSIMKTKHYLDYVSILNRIDYIHHLFSTGIGASLFSNTINASSEEIAHTITLIASISLVPSDWLEPLEKIISGLDGVSVLKKGQPFTLRMKLETVWVMIHGILAINMTNPSLADLTMNQTHYDLYQKIIEILSRWGWSKWFLKKESQDHLFQGQRTWIGNDVYYVPTPQFPRVFSIFLEDHFNEISRNQDLQIIRDFNTIYNENDIGAPIVTLLKSIDSLKSLGTPYKFPSTIEGVQDIRDSITGLYTQLQILQYILSNVPRIISFHLSQLFPSDFSVAFPNSKIEEIPRLITTIHLEHQSKRKALNYPDKSIGKIVDDIADILSSVSQMNRITPQISLISLPKPMFRITSQNIYELVIETLRKGQYIPFTGSDVGQIKKFLQDTERNWKKKLPESTQVPDLSPLYTVLTYVVTIARELSKSISMKWYEVRKHILESIGIGRSLHRLRKILGDLDKRFDVFSGYLHELELLSYTDARDKEYEIALNMQGIIVDTLPYLRSKESDISKKIKKDINHSTNQKSV